MPGNDVFLGEKLFYIGYVYHVMYVCVIRLLKLQPGLVTLLLESYNPF